jgi:hypothetical protein
MSQWHLLKATGVSLTEWLPPVRFISVRDTPVALSKCHWCNELFFINACRG